MCATRPNPTFDGSCAFCRIVQGADDPPARICEGADWLAFFPLDPVTPGHTLVVPKSHIPDLWDVDAELATSLMRAVIDVGRAVRQALDPEGMNLITSSGDAAQQTIYHLHLHVVPRWRSDGFGALWPDKRHMAEELRRDAAARIRHVCRTMSLGVAEGEANDERRGDERQIEEH